MKSPLLRPMGSGHPLEQCAAGPVNASTVLVRALLAYSVHEHQDQAGAATRINLRLQPRSCCIEDDGRGIGLHRDGYVAGLLEQLAARRSEVALHGIGLAVIAMASPKMDIESRRNGQLFTQTFAWGVAQGPVRVEPWGGPTGTRITLRLSEEAAEIDFAQVIAQVEIWRAAHPGLEFKVSVYA